MTQKIDYRRIFVVRTGDNLESLRQLLGHSDIKTTQKYLNVTPQHLDKTVDLLESYLESNKK